MAGRLISDGIYGSDKLLSLEEKYRPQYAWILPLANPNACCEVTPTKIWHRAYALIQPSWTVDNVTKLLDELERVKLLFRFDHEGKRMGFFVGMQKHLPKPSERIKYKDGKSIVPAEGLAEYLGDDIETVLRQYRDIVALRMGCRNGIGTGLGLDEALGRDMVLANATDGVEDNDRPNSIPSPSPAVLKTNSHSIPLAAGEQQQPSEPESLISYFRSLLDFNPNFDATKLKPNWKLLWARDFTILLETYSFQAAGALIAYSQTEHWRTYNVRAKLVLEQAESIAAQFRIPTLAQERDGMPVPGIPRE